MRMLPADLLERAQALLNMTEQNGCTPHEAANAAARLLRLAEKHGVKLEDLCPGSAQENAVIRVVAAIRFRGHYGAEGVLSFGSSLALGFECAMLQCNAAKFRRRIVFFAGFESDAKCAAFAFESLLPRLAREARRAGHARQMTSFLAGAGETIKFRLVGERHAMRQAESGECGAAVILKSRKAVLIERNLNRTGVKTRNRHGTLLDPRAFAAGRIAGESIDLRKGIEQTGRPS